MGAHRDMGKNPLTSQSVQGTVVAAVVTVLGELGIEVPHEAVVQAIALAWAAIGLRRAMTRYRV